MTPKNLRRNVDSPSAPLRRPARDPAAEFALTRHEIEWLADFLASDRVPPTAMSIEILDGYFTALAVGPEPVVRSEYFRRIWSSEGSDGPSFDNDAQRDRFDTFLSRHLRTIATRIEAGYPHRPLLEDDRPGQEGCAWCYGFLVGIGLRVDAWEPCLTSKKMEPLIALIGVLAEADELSDMAPNPSEERAEVIEALSGIPLAIRGFWRDRGGRSH